MKTTPILFALALLLFFTSNCFSQNELKKTATSKLQLGYHLNQFQNDFGIGIDITSPYFIFRSIGLRGSTNVQWLQSISTSSLIYNWSPYQNFKFGLTGKSFPVSNNINIYGEGGLAIISPNKNFSNESLVVGGYGVFGFEFFTTNNFCYYLEFGGIGTGAVAENSLNKPIYSNGFTTSVGMRVKL